MSTSIEQQPSTAQPSTAEPIMSAATSRTSSSSSTRRRTTSSYRRRSSPSWQTLLKRAFTKKTGIPTTKSGWATKIGNFIIGLLSSIFSTKKSSSTKTSSSTKGNASAKSRTSTKKDS